MKSLLRNCARRGAVHDWRLLLGIALVFCSTATLRAQPRLREFSLTRPIRIGADDGGAAELQGFVRPLRAPNGDTYVAAGCTITRFNTGGRLLATLGRCGDGPGEFRSIAALGLLRDTLWVADQHHRRVTLFGTEGRVVTTYPLSYDPRHPALARAVPTAMLRGDIAIAEGALASPQSEAAESRAPVRSPLVRLQRNGGVLDTLATLVVRTAPDIIVTLRDMWLGTYRQPHTLTSHWTARSDGEALAVADVVPTPTPHISLRLFDARGRVTSSRRVPFTPMPWTARLRDSAMAALEAYALPEEGPTVSAADRDAVRKQLRAQLVLPPFVPPLTHFLLGNDGSIWLRREEYAPGGPIWQVLNAAGEFIGSLRAPPGARVVYADLTRVLSVEADPDGIPYVVAYTLHTGGGS